MFHLAGQVRDTLVEDMDHRTFSEAHDPKAIGAHLLHRHLRDEPLDHFVLFASIASLLTTASTRPTTPRATRSWTRWPSTAGHSDCRD